MNKKRKCTRKMFEEKSCEKIKKYYNNNKKEVKKYLKTKQKSTYESKKK